MENEIKDKWNEIITYMRDTYNINGVLFRTWISPLTIVSCDNDTIILAIDEKEQGDILGLIEKKIQSCFSGIHRSYYKSSTGCPFYLSK